MHLHWMQVKANLKISFWSCRQSKFLKHPPKSLSRVLLLGCKCTLRLISHWADKNVKAVIRMECYSKKMTDNFKREFVRFLRLVNCWEVHIRDESRITKCNATLWRNSFYLFACKVWGFGVPCSIKFHRIWWIIQCTGMLPKLSAKVICNLNKTCLRKQTEICWYF